MNPLFRREFLARWRDWRSHLLLLGLAVLLGTAAYLSYAAALESPPPTSMVSTILPNGAMQYNMVPVVESVTTRASRAGHALFTTLALGNVGVWFVLAPVLLSTGVARERERGLLESLQLSPMLPASQIAARTLSALSFLLVLQLATIPIYFVAFSFGGVSQEEIGRVWEVVLASGFCGVGVGLMLSAESNRPSSALFSAVMLLVAWSVAAFLGGAILVYFFGAFGWTGWTQQALFFSHPLAVVWQLCEPKVSLGPSLWSFSGVEAALPWAIGGWLLVGVLALIKATRDVTRAFAPAGWSEGNTLIGWWKAKRAARLKRREQRRVNISVEGALLADLPFDKLIRFKNPLLNREVKAKFRVRRASPWIWTGRFLLFMAGALAFSMVIFSVFYDPPAREGAVPVVLWMEWGLGLALVGPFAAASFAREREAGTWEGLQLSLLSPLEIARTKWASPLWAWALITCPLWLLLFALLPLGSWNGVPVRWVLLGALVVLASLAFVSALGLLVSLRAKSATSATCWTLAALFLLFVVAPLAERQSDVPNTLSSWRYGVANSDYVDESFKYNSPELLARYQQDTGRDFNPFVNGRSARLQGELTLYTAWYRERRAAAGRFQKMLFAWSPIYVLEAFSNQGRPSPRYGYNYGQQVFSLRDDDIAWMAFYSIALSGAATFGLLVVVTRRLNGRAEPKTVGQSTKRVPLMRENKAT